MVKSCGCLPMDWINRALCHATTKSPSRALDTESPAQQTCVQMKRSDMFRWSSHRKWEQSCGKANWPATRVRISVRDNTLSQREYQGKLTFPTQSYTEIAAAGFELFCKKHTWNNNIRSLAISAIDLIPLTRRSSSISGQTYQAQQAPHPGAHHGRHPSPLWPPFHQFRRTHHGAEDACHREVEYKMPSVMYH